MQAALLILPLLLLLPLQLRLLPFLQKDQLRRGDDPRRYNTSGGPVPGKLNVHLVPHTHDDVGWLKTVDQYFVGSNNSIQVAAVQYILDSVITSLEEDSNRKFIYVEQAFFQRWWRQQTKSKQEAVKKLVANGQLEFINGGWCMHDEATTHYIDMIDQTTLGHRFIKQQFDKVPSIAWQIDPFGHSAVQAYLLGAEAGFDAIFFARADYQDVAQRRTDLAMEFIWRGSKTLGSSSQIFGGILFHHYSPPDGLSFDIKSTDPVIQDDPLLYDYNLDERINLYVQYAQDQSKYFRSNHIMWTMGEDFTYENANTWFKQMDKIVHYMNKDGRTNVFYSTPSIYLQAKNAANATWPVKTDDFFPYADCKHCYWTGFFSSRPALKRYVRRLSGYLLAVRQVEVLFGKDQLSDSTDALEEAVAILQHHDGVSGTEKQHVADDYAQRLASGASQAASLFGHAISSLLLSSINPEKLLPKRSSRFQMETFTPNLKQCPLLNISYCPPSESNLGIAETLVVIAYNPLAWNRDEFVRIPVSSQNMQVKDSSGRVILAQVLPMDYASRKLRQKFTPSYKSNDSNLYVLVFKAYTPPMGFSSYFITEAKNSSYERTVASTITDLQQDGEPFLVHSGDLSLSFGGATRKLSHIVNRGSGITASVEQSYCWYNSSDGRVEDDGAVCRRKCLGSGAYMFRPNTSTCYSLDVVSTVVIEGPLVKEIHQEFSPWLSQVIRLYEGTSHAEIEYTVGPVPVYNNSEAGKEVIMKLSSNVSSGDVFFTDSNGRDFIKRVRDYRKDWSLEVMEKVAGNYYPLNLGMYIRGNGTDLSVLVDRAAGGSSLSDGQVEIMLHRRILYDDNRGVNEALNEIVCSDTSDSATCEGLTVRGTLLIGLHSEASAARWRRTQGQKLYSSPELLFLTLKNEEIQLLRRTEFSATLDSLELPPNIALITFQVLQDNEVLLRLAHLYEADEDEELSRVVKVNLQDIFGTKKIKDVIELSLSANQERSKMRKPRWNAPSVEQIHVMRGRPLKQGEQQIEIAPMEIRTLRVKLQPY